MSGSDRPSAPAPTESWLLDVLRALQMSPSDAPGRAGAAPASGPGRTSADPFADLLDSLGSLAQAFTESPAAEGIRGAPGGPTSPRPSALSVVQAALPGLTVRQVVRGRAATTATGSSDRLWVLGAEQFIALWAAPDGVTTRRLEFAAIRAVRQEGDGRGTLTLVLEADVSGQQHRFRLFGVAPDAAHEFLLGLAAALPQPARASTSVPATASVAAVTPERVPPPASRPAPTGARPSGPDTVEVRLQLLERLRTMHVAGDLTDDEFRVLRARALAD